MLFCIDTFNFTDVAFLFKLFQDLSNRSIQIIYMHIEPSLYKFSLFDTCEYATLKRISPIRFSVGLFVYLPLGIGLGKWIPEYNCLGQFSESIEYKPTRKSCYIYKPIEILYSYRRCVNIETTIFVNERLAKQIRSCLSKYLHFRISKSGLYFLDGLTIEVII